MRLADPRYLTSAALCCATAILLTTTTLGAQSTERQMIVSVLDDAGVPVRDLDVTDFEIREDGAVRELLRVGPAGADREIALLADTSTAATGAISDIRKGLTAFVIGMHEGNRISLITFGGRPRIRIRPTTSAERLRNGLDDLFALSGEAAYMLDAMTEVAEGFSRRGAIRPIMVVLATNGLDYSNANAREVIEALTTSGAAAYTFLLRTRQHGFSADAFNLQSATWDQKIEREVVLGRGINESGGRHQDILSAAAIERAMNALVTELRNQYLVVYSRPNVLIPPENVSVSVTRDSVTVRGVLLRAE